MLPTSAFQHMHKDISAVGQRMPVMQKLWLCCSIRNCGLDLCLRICFTHCRPLLTCTMTICVKLPNALHMYNLPRTYSCTDGGLSQNSQRLYVTYLSGLMHFVNSTMQGFLMLCFPQVQHLLHSGLCSIHTCQLESHHSCIYNGLFPIEQHSCKVHVCE